MEVVFTEKAQKDIAFWKNTGNATIQKKITELIKDIEKHPETGIGKPERLKHKYCGVWSRRINQQHRILYLIEEKIVILSLKGHYE
ncbi:MAG: Txe/YoeB family addiction module toxin [Bacteroidales bacterium]|nr:Txe/YoeB family addiction module toxin [Bacteroidales bacterium]